MREVLKFGCVADNCIFKVHWREQIGKDSRLVPELFYKVLVKKHTDMRFQRLGVGMKLEQCTLQREGAFCKMKCWGQKIFKVTFQG